MPALKLGRQFFPSLLGPLWPVVFCSSCSLFWRDPWGPTARYGRTASPSRSEGSGGCVCRAVAIRFFRALPSVAIWGRALRSVAMGGRALPSVAIGGRALPSVAIGGRALPSVAMGGRAVPFVGSWGEIA